MSMLLQQFPRLPDYVDDGSDDGRHEDDRLQDFQDCLHVHRRHPSLERRRPHRDIAGVGDTLLPAAGTKLADGLLQAGGRRRLIWPELGRGAAPHPGVPKSASCTSMDAPQTVADPSLHMQGALTANAACIAERRRAEGFPSCDVGTQTIRS